MANEYVTLAELKATLGIGSSQTYADDDIDLAREAASRAVDDYKQTRFWATAETRYYSPPSNQRTVYIDEAASVSSVKLDMDGDGTFETTLTSGTDYKLEPLNATALGRPYDALTLLPRSGRYFPGLLGGLQVTGSFGWSSTPPQVRQATSILSARLLKRSREAPFAIQMAAAEMGANARIGRIDPDVAFLLDQLPTRPRMILR